MLHGNFSVEDKFGAFEFIEERGDGTERKRGEFGDAVSQDRNKKEKGIFEFGCEDEFELGRGISDIEEAILIKERREVTKNESNIDVGFKER